eukprot:2698302-Rhodomonas_salina.2
MWYGPCDVRMCASDLAYGAGGRAVESQVPSAICLRACYAMSGTDISICSCYAMSIFSCYAMSGTGRAYGPTCLRFSYAMCGTGTAYNPNLIRSCYAMRGTETAYGAARMDEAAMVSEWRRDEDLRYLRGEIKY